MELGDKNEFFETNYGKQSIKEDECATPKMQL